MARRVLDYGVDAILDRIALTHIMVGPAIALEWPVGRRPGFSIHRRLVREPDPVLEPIRGGLAVVDDLAPDAEDEAAVEAILYGKVPVQKDVIAVEPNVQHDRSGHRNLPIRTS